MIKCSTEQGSLNLEVHGEVTEILVDLNLIVSEIYKEIHGECAREYFKDVFESGLFAGLAFIEDKKDGCKVVTECIKKRRDADEEKKSELKQIGAELEELVKMIKDL